MPDESGVTRFALRVPTDLYEKFKALSEREQRVGERTTDRTHPPCGRRRTP